MFDIGFVINNSVSDNIIVIGVYTWLYVNY